MAAPAVEPRAQFYAGSFALEEALFGLDNQDEAALRRELAALI